MRIRNFGLRIGGAAKDSVSADHSTKTWELPGISKVIIDGRYSLM